MDAFIRSGSWRPDKCGDLKCPNLCHFYKTYFNVSQIEQAIKKLSV